MMMAPFQRRHLSFRQWQLVISPVWGLPIQHSWNSLLSGTIPHPITLASLKRFFPLTVNALGNIYLNLPLRFVIISPHHRLISSPLSFPSHSCFFFLIPLLSHIISYATTNLHRHPRSISLGRPRHFLRSIKGRLAHSITKVR